MRLAAGQVAVVTGGASGIGLGLAGALVDRGLRVVVSDVGQAGIDQAVASLRRRGEVLGVLTDVRDQDAVFALAATTIAEFGRVDLICNNAGVVPPPGPMWEMDLKAWTWPLDVMLMGVVHGIRAFVPHLVAQGSGHVLNTASLGGLMPLPFLAPYNAAKHAVVGLTETLAVELSRQETGVGASVLCPGQVATGLGETSARNRPAELTNIAPPAPTAPVAAPPQQGKVLTSEEVARITLAAIEADRVHVLPNIDRAEGVRKRVQDLLDDVDWMASSGLAD